MIDDEIPREVHFKMFSGIQITHLRSNDQQPNFIEEL